MERIQIGNKKYSLNQIWKLCIKMWKYVVEQNKRVISAKEDWLKNNDFELFDVDSDCFFCEWTKQMIDKIPDDYDVDNRCQLCPGRLVDKKFDCCGSKYHYLRHPRKFLKKVLVLNKKRRSK